MTPATRKPWWDELSMMRRVAVFASPPICVVLGLAGLVVIRPSGLELAGLLLLVVAGAALCVSNVRDLVRKRSSHLA
jgi:hypothetical protein